MQTETNKNIPEDEIDLRSIGLKFYSLLTYPFSLLFSNKLIAGSFIIVAVLLSVGIKYISPKIYTSSFILRSTDIKDKIYFKILDDIPALFRKGDKKALEGLLHLDSLTLHKLVQIKVILPGTKIKSDSTNTLEIELQSRDTRIFLPVQTAIMSYLENNPYYSKIRNLQKEQIELTMTQLDKDLIQLDSLKKLQLGMYEGHKGALQNTILLNELVNPVEAYNAGTERISKKAGLLAQNVFLDRFHLIKGCVIPTRHSWPPRILVLSLFTIPFSLLFCFIFLHYRRRER